MLRKIFVEGESSQMELLVAKNFFGSKVPKVPFGNFGTFKSSESSQSSFLELSTKMALRVLKGGQFAIDILKRLTFTVFYFEFWGSKKD